MVSRAFPVAYASDVDRAAKFWELLGFERFFEMPRADGSVGYVGLRSDNAELAITHRDWPKERFGLEMGGDPRFEMYVYVEDLDGTVERLRGNGVNVLRDPEDMPWGERVATVTDADGNPVTLCAAQPSS